MSTKKRMIIHDQCDITADNVVQEIDMDDLERLFKSYGAKYENFGRLEIHFDYHDDNDWDGMIEIKNLDLMI